MCKEACDKVNPCAFITIWEKPGTPLKCYINKYFDSNIEETTFPNTSYHAIDRTTKTADQCIGKGEK